MSDENKRRKNRNKPLEFEENKKSNKEEEYIDVGTDDLKEEEKLPYVPYREEKNSLFESDLPEDSEDKTEVKETSENTFDIEGVELINTDDEDTEEDENVLDLGHDEEGELDLPSDNKVEDLEVPVNDNEEDNTTEEVNASEEDTEIPLFNEEGNFWDLPEEENEQKDDVVTIDYNEEEDNPDSYEIDYTEKGDVVETSDNNEEITETIIDEMEFDNQEVRKETVEHSNKEEDTYVVDLTDENEDYLNLSDEEELKNLNLTSEEKEANNNEEDTSDNLANDEELEGVTEITEEKPNKKLKPKIIIGVIAGAVALAVVAFMLFSPMRNGFDLLGGLFKEVEDPDPTMPIQPEIEDFDPDVKVVDEIDENEERVTEETEELKENLKPMYEEVNSYVDKVSQTKSTIVIEGTVSKVKDTKNPQYEIIRLARWSQIPAYEFLVDDLINVQVKLKYKSDEYFFETSKPVIEFIARLNYEDRHSSQLWWDKTTALRNGTSMKKDLVKDRLYVEYAHPIYYEPPKPENNEDGENNGQNEEEAKVETLSSGDHTVGVDINEGRYKISILDGERNTGTLRVDATDFKRSRFETFGPNNTKETVVNLMKDDIVRISGLNEVKIEFLGPVQTNPKDEDSNNENTIDLEEENDVEDSE